METKAIQKKTNKKVSMSKEKRREALVGWLFITPEIIGMVCLSIFPILFSLYLSFNHWDLIGGLSEIRFVGLENFKELFQDERIFIALKNNIYFTVLVVPITMVIALIIAIVINSEIYFKDYFKVAFFIPYISSIIAVGAVWRALYHPSQGPINQFLMSIGVTEPPAWLASTSTSLLAIIIISIWAQVGYVVIIYLAGLTNIPRELYEAAEIDGANGFQRFYRITMPLLNPTHMFLAITLLIGSFKVFDLVKFLTDGGPVGSSSVLVYLIYKEGFERFNMGYASAISWLLFFIVGLLTFITWNLQQKEE